MSSSRTGWLREGAIVREKACGFQPILAAVGVDRLRIRAAIRSDTEHTLQPFRPVAHLWE